jgi:hypothetical protein
VLRSDRHSDRDGDSSDGFELGLGHVPCQTVRQTLGSREVDRRNDHCELLPADAEHVVGVAYARPQHPCDFGKYVVAEGVAVDVVDALEVVEVEHHDGHTVMRHGGTEELRPEHFVERAMVEEPGQRVGLGLMLEACPDVRVVEGECGRVAEARCQAELLLREEHVFAFAVDVERPLEAAAGDEGHDDQRLRLDRRAGHKADAGIEVRLIREHRLPVLDSPAGDPFSEREALGEHLLGPA